MGQCGCGDYQPARQYRVKGCVVGVELYPGCDYCTDQVSVAVHLFTPSSPFAGSHKTETVQPDDDGACLPAIPVLSVADLRAAFKAMECQYDPADPDGYATLDDYLHDYGLRIVQEAIRLCAQRCKANTQAHGRSGSDVP